MKGRGPVGAMPSAPRPNPAVLLLPVVAVTVGIASVLLAGPGGTGSSSLTGPSTPFIAHVSATEIVLAAALLFLGTVAVLVYRRTRADSIGVPSRFVVMGLTLVALGIVFVLLVHVIAFAGPVGTPSSTTPGSGNGGAHSVNVSSAPPSGNTSTSVGPSSGLPLPNGWPSWVPYAAVAVAALAVVAAVVVLTRRGQVADAARPKATPAAVELAGRRALDALTGRPAADPRSAILAAYGEFLAVVAGRAVPIEARTAREIAATLTEAWGVGSTASGELTALFEEARYSSRPIGPAELARARSALEAVLTELGRGGGAS